MNVSNNISSIQAHTTMLNTSGHNIANVNTDGFVPSDTRMLEIGSSVTAYNTKADDNGSATSQTDLAKEIPDEMIAQNATEVNVAAIKIQDEMFGTLLDIKA
jgi:flagellar hook protein FlgE